MTGPTNLTSDIRELLYSGTVIPAHPLALNEKRHLDVEHQRALTRYYVDSGVGGIAVGVHTTQFEIRNPGVGLFRPVLELAAETVDELRLKRPFLKVAGIVGPTKQALAEAEQAAELGYHLGLLSTGGLTDWTEDAILERVREVAQVIPVFGFYLQPAVGGRVLSRNFWEQMCDIPGVLAIKMAPFDRYRTLDVARAVCASRRRDDIALYTGNDDNIIVDLLTRFRFVIDGRVVEKRIVGGLLGHWAVWTKRVVEWFERIKEARDCGDIPAEFLTLAAQVTDANAALFDPAHQFAGCIPGIHEILRRQGLMSGTWCLNPNERLSPGQLQEIDRVCEEYPHLTDDVFVREHVAAWCGAPSDDARVHESHLEAEPRENLFRSF